MRLYDTACRGVRDFEPVGPTADLYVCGITPYDAAHLGHAFTYHVIDVLTRRLLADGTAVRSIRNITDCDDDVFRVARQRGIDHRTLVAEQVERFDTEMASIDILGVSAAPRASDEVPAMIDWISQLVWAGFAYSVEGWVYFAAARFTEYGALSRLERPRMLALSRERGGDPDDPRKRDPLDFVLWQPSAADELAWNNPWGAPGRPGWHIECTVLARRHCPDGIDLHGGGEDLIFPHHECEIAQAEAIAPPPFARHWLHVAMVGLDGVKMSKSLGNLVFIGDLLRGASPAALRLMLASHHHRTAWDYDPSELDAANARVASWRRAMRDGAWLDAEAAADAERQLLARLDDDLDTPGAVAVLDRAVRRARRSRDAPPGTVGLVGLLPRLAGLLGAGSL